jgi:hypothetical protein
MRVGLKRELPFASGALRARFVIFARADWADSALCLRSSGANPPVDCGANRILCGQDEGISPVVAQIGRNLVAIAFPQGDNRVTLLATRRYGAASRDRLRTTAL